MNNEQKAELYHSYLLRHDKLESQIADIKSEAAGRDLNEEQKLYLLENSYKRGWKDHHLDHIFPIAIAFKEKIPPEKVGNIKNLRFIPYEENLSKGSKVTNESKNALRRIKRLK